MSAIGYTSLITAGQLKKLLVAVKPDNNLQIAKKIIKLMHKSADQIEFVKDRPGHDRKYAVDWTKINKQLEWKPDMDLTQGLQDTVNWYTQNTWWWKKIKSQSESIYVKSN
jgi:dTDP-glucose 4,6-dehydratase